MKAFLLTGAALMIGAAIYGITDYRQTSRKKEFKALYTETPATPEVKYTATTTNATAPVTSKNAVTAGVPGNESKNASPAKKKIKKKKRTFNTRLFSRGALDERYILPPPVETKTDKPQVEKKENR